MNGRTHADVIVVGAGPAGTCAATVLARAGVSVVVVERESFPRFVIGESLLPGCLEVFDRLGVDPAAAGFLRKSGARFVDEGADRASRFGFDEGLDPSKGHAYHVDRADFDLWLAEVAMAAGARVSFGRAAVDTNVAPGGAAVEQVTVELGDGARLSARYLLDATGSRAWLGRRLRALEPRYDLGKAGVHARFEGLSPKARAALEPSGDIIISLYGEGTWGWAIPLAGGRLSVGTVSSTRPPDVALFEDTVGRSALLGELTAGAQRGPLTPCGNFSFRNAQPYGARYVSVGDAAGFLDPLFSSGVTLAMLGGVWTADRLVQALASGDEADPGLMVDVHRKCDVGYRCFERLVQRFYHGRLGANMLLASEPPEPIRRGLVSVLGADLWRDDNEFQRMLLSPGRA